MKAGWQPQIGEDYRHGATDWLTGFSDHLGFHNACPNGGCRRHGRCFPEAHWIRQMNWSADTAFNISRRGLPPCLAEMWDELLPMFREAEDGGQADVCDGE